MHKKQDEAILKTIIITGVGGFIGSALARHTVKAGYEVYGLDRRNVDEAALSGMAEIVHSELPSRVFAELLQRVHPDAIVHCAGGASVPAAMADPYSDFVAGPALTFDLLENMRLHAPACTFLLISSAAVYGNPGSLPVGEAAQIKPISSYGFHKWQSEMICQEFAGPFGLHTASARVFSAYGPGLRRQALWDITRKLLTEPEVHLQGTGRESRDFIHIADIVRGLEVLIAHAPFRGEAYNLASGRETCVADLAKWISELLGSTKRIVFSGELPPGTPTNWQADIRLISSLGFHPELAIRDGLDGFVDWARDQIEGN